MAYTTLTSIFGALNIPDDDYVFVNTFGQEAIYDATLQLLGNHNADLAAAESIFIERETFNHISRYYLATGGRLEKISNNTQPNAVKAIGQWDVAYPLEEWASKLEGTRVQMGYMSTGQYGRHIQQVLASDVNTRRFEMLKALFNNGGGAPRVFVDENWGNLNVQPLANGDVTLYPPIVGAEVNATSNHYLCQGFAPAAISDANDPYTPAIDLLEGHFGIPTAGSNMVTFINKAQVKITENLPSFNPIEYRFQDLGADVTRADNYPEGLPGRVIGEYGGKCLLVRWDWIPANYTFTVHLDAPKPLVRRIDPPGTGLTPGLQLVSQTMEHPFRSAIWSQRFGYGVGNRLNGVVQYIDAGGSYVVPTVWQ